MPRHFHALAVDYDGTIAHDGHVSDSTVAALRSVKESGRKLLLVTGREKADLQIIFPHFDLFDWMVLENGALLIEPETGERETIGKPPPSDFIRALEEKGVPVNLGKVILASWEPHEQTILETIKELGLDLQVIFNKGAVMVLPAGVNKATGLMRALGKMGLSPINVAGVGDAENDHAFLNICGCSAATANALPKLKERVDIVLQGDHGKGVEELIEAMLNDDLLAWSDRLGRHSVRIGKTDEGERIEIPPFGANVLIAGTSGGGKSTLTTGLMERLVDHNLQFCIIDPEGDHSSFDEAMILGSSKRPPSTDEVVHFFDNAERSAIVDLLGQPLQERPHFFLSLLPRLLQRREETARPHWIIVDEAHHMLPGPWDFASHPFPKDIERMMYITLLPSNLPDSILKTVDIIIAVGNEPENIVADFCKAAGEDMPEMPEMELEKGTAMVWMRGMRKLPVKVRLPENRSKHRRHSRKYAEGELSPERSFYFRGPEGKLNIRAQNVYLFLQIAEGVDEETIMHHARQHDFSTWFIDHAKDEHVGKEIRLLEDSKDLTRDKVIEGMRAIIEEHYTLPSGYAWPTDRTA
jgi:hydroxymethylpyrimidine pyrophosphatase-like HAD family hydrolase